MTPVKWVSIQGLPVFSSLDYIIWVENQMRTHFWPDKIIKSVWDFHAVSGTVTTLPQQGNTLTQRWPGTGNPHPQ